MALLWMDSVQHYSTANKLTKWSAESLNGYAVVAGGRFGGNCLRGNSDNNGWQRLNLGATYGTLINGFAYKTTALTLSHIICSFRDNSTNQVDLRINTSGNLYVTRSGTTLATGATALAQDTWYYIEWKVLIANAGSFTVRVNGITDANLNGVSADTQNTANAYADQYQIGDNGGLTTYNYMGDIYIADTSGGAPTNDFLGDSKVEALFPNGNGNSSQFVGSDGNSTDNYLLVDETTPDDDTTYVQSNVVGNKDTYAYTDLVSTSGTVYGVQIIPRMRKTDAGSRTAVSVARLSGVETDSAAKSVFDSYLYVPDIREAKPGGGAWTISDVNSAEFGIKVNS